MTKDGVDWEFDEEDLGEGERGANAPTSAKLAMRSEQVETPTPASKAPLRSFAEFFRSITGHAPLPYQLRLGTEAWPELLDVPTGLGKTAAVVVAWLFKQLRADHATGRRLVYCLPMRVLVEQTARVVRDWCAKASPQFADKGAHAPTMHVLMGGDVDESWESEPERPAVLIGTQDMLLSRALNRGYALSRYKWPVHYGLLNNDCLWVFDETQLLGVGVETSAQLQGLRKKLGAHGPAHTLWMSATLGSRQLETVDHTKPASGWNSIQLAAADLDEHVVQKRVRAAKPIVRSNEPRLDKDSDKGGGYVESLVKRVVEAHTARGGLTLVILNRVARAQALHQALLRHQQNTALIHSRFRTADRSREEAVLHDTSADRIVVATQAVEAGVDVSARTMFSELAPWPSLVQRFGRCNRYGEDDATIHWLDIDTSDEKSGLALPYAASELDEARKLLAALHDSGADAGPERLRQIQYEPPLAVRPVIRRRDALDLFDTTPDLSGNDIDVSRYVRDGDDTDVQFYWREFEPPEPIATLQRPAREELCRVSIAGAREFLDKLEKQRKRLAGGSEKDRGTSCRLQAWQWDPLDEQWERAVRPYPGQVLLLHSGAGGYEPRSGWTGAVGPKAHVPPVVQASLGAPADAEAYGGDPDTVLKRWVLLADHLGHVRDEAGALAFSAGLSKYTELLATAGMWHDVGKAHEVFQHKLLAPLERRPELTPEGAGPWAKSNHRLSSSEMRKHFRHELASALAWLAANTVGDAERRDLIAYLIAAHHGKVRLSLRSLPGESRPSEPERLFARGVWDGDVLPAIELPDGRRLEAIQLDLSVMQLGEGSWLERMLKLRDADHLGPFRLAMLETIVRIADWRASRKEEEGAYDG